MEQEITTISPNSEEYHALVEECTATATELYTQHKWVLIEMYHTLGRTIRDYVSPEVQITQLLRDLAADTGIHERNLWYAVQFYDQYPITIDELPGQLPGGKEISWTQIRKELPASQSHEKREVFDPHDQASKIVKKQGVENSREIARAILVIVNEYEMNS